MSTPNPATVWSRIYNDVKMQIPGVTDAVFKQMLYQVWGDFTDRTNVWTEEVPIDVGPSTTVYPFTLAKGGTPNRLMLFYDPGLSPARQWVQGSIGMDKPGVITLMFAPSNAATWNAVVAKTPNEVDADGYPELDTDDQWIVEKYGDGLHYGILGRLQAMPVKPFSNARMASQNWQIYIMERGKARTDALKSNVYNGQRWMFPQPFATIGRKGWT